MTFLAEAKAEAEGGKKFGLRPNTEAEAEGLKIPVIMFLLRCTPLHYAAESVIFPTRLKIDY